MSVRVLQAMAGAPHGGAEAFFTRLVLALGRAGLEQRIVIRQDAARARALRAADLDTVELPFGGFFDLRTRVALKRQIAAFAPQVVLTWMSRASRHCPAGPFVHAARLGGYYDLKYYRKCHHLVGNTRDIVAYLVREGWPENRAHYLPNFVSEAEAAPADRDTLTTPAQATVLLALGRLHENKAFDVLIDAVAKVEDCWLWLAGEGPLRAALENQARALGVEDRVRFLGWRDDVPALLAAADILVCPSRHEPLGNVVIEAWAHRVPVVAAASQGPSALIEADVSGLLVPVEDSDALAGAIGRLATDRAARERLVAGGRAAYEAEFQEAAVVGQYLDFFDRIAA